MASLPPHVQWIARNMGKPLRAILDRQGVDREVEAALAVLVEADPSPGAHGVQWLCQALIGGGMRWEDVAAGATSRARQTLELFAQHRSQLDRAQRNLASHAGLGDVYAAIQPLLEPRVEHDSTPLVGRALRRHERAQAYQDSIVLYNGDDLVVAVPTTQAAARWWGRGTQWCTAADAHNMFDSYNKLAPLIVLALRDRAQGSEHTPHDGGDMQLAQSTQGAWGKLQLYVGPNDDVQFMDSMDRTVPPEFVHANWSVLGPVVSWLVEGNPGTIAYVPPQHRDRQMCLRAVQHDGKLIALVPHNIIDQELCTIAVDNAPSSLDCVPEHYRNVQMYHDAVLAKPGLLRLVPAHMQSTQMCRHAVAMDGIYLRHVAEPDAEMCWMAVGNCGHALEFVPRKLLTQAICLRAVSRSPQALADVPVAWRSRELCMLAIQHNANTIRHVPPDILDTDMIVLASRSSGVLWQIEQDRLDDETLLELVRQTPARIQEIDLLRRSAALCAIALQADPLLLPWVPPSLVTQDMCRQGFAQDGLMLGEVPKPLRTSELCRIAVTNNCHALKYVPDHLRGELYGIALQGLAKSESIHSYRTGYRSGGLAESAFNFIPDELKTHQSCMDALRVHAMSLKHVPLQLRNHEVCLSAVERDPATFWHVPPDMRDHEICLAAARQNPALLLSKEPELRTRQLYHDVVSGNGEALRYVPMDMRTPELCMLALAESRYAVQHVPDHLRELLSASCPDLDRVPRPQWGPEVLDGLRMALAQMERHIQAEPQPALEERVQG